MARALPSWALRKTALAKTAMAKTVPPEMERPKMEAVRGARRRRPTVGMGAMLPLP